MRFLVFTLYAPIASWGDTTVGEVRSSWDRPSRSATLGLCAASLGVTRKDTHLHEALDAGLGMGIRQAAAGTTLVDYHTAQDPPANVVRKRRPRTRREALLMVEPETTLSQRTVRLDSLHVLALWERASMPWTLDALGEALRTPKFVLYAGRKANALGLPLSPRVVVLETLAEALGAMPDLPGEMGRLEPRDGWGRVVAHDRCEGFDAGLDAMFERPLPRRDATPHRTRWTFSERQVHMGTLRAGGTS